MQSFSHLVDDTLTVESLSNLGGKINPAAGWEYRVRRLERELRLHSNGLAQVVQDALANSYQLVTQ